MGSVTLNATKNAWTNRTQPATNYSSGNYASFYDPETDRFYLAFSSYPSSIELKPIQRVEIHQYARLPRDPSNDVVPVALKYGALSADWDEKSVTYFDKPYSLLSEITGYHDESQNYWFTIYQTRTSLERIRSILAYGMAMAPKDIYGYYADDVTLATRFNSTPSLRPYLVIVHDDDNAFLTPTLQERSGYINPAVQQTFNFSTSASSIYILGSLSIVSRSLSWKLPGSATWTTISIPGTGKVLSVPANTFPAGEEEVQVKVSVTDNGGTTTDSAPITISTKDALLTANTSGPKDGYIVDETRAQTFYWFNSSPNLTPATGADLELSTDGSTWTPLGSVSGPGTTYTLPANTLPVAALFWRVRSYNSDGDPGPWSDPAEFTTIDTDAVATPATPYNTVEDANAPIKFRWTVLNESGALASGADLQSSTNGTTWTDLTSVSGSAGTATVPAGTFSAGTVYWRVRSYNRQGVPGPWSSAAPFIAVGAPPAPAVSCDAVPFATITWQAQEQQAYRITLDGELLGTFFGKGNTHTLSDPLEDGEHVVTVSVQNGFSMWSTPTECVFLVINEPGDAVDLSVKFGIDAELAWSTDSAEPDFLVYRDGKQIAASDKLAFVDRLSIGPHEYCVLSRLPDGNYTRSNIVSGILKACTTVIDRLENPVGWMELQLTEKSNSEQAYNYQRTGSLRHFAGAAYPVLELSGYEDLNGSYDVAFPDVESARAFEAFRGQVVILKSRGGNIVIGPLLQLSKRNGDFYIAYTFTVQQIHVEDWIDDQNS